MNRWRRPYLYLLAAFVAAGMTLWVYWPDKRAPFDLAVSKAGDQDVSLKIPDGTDALLPDSLQVQDFGGSLNPPEGAARPKPRDSSDSRSLAAPLVDELDAQLAKARSGDIAAAAQLAKDLRTCSRYVERLTDLTAQVSVAQGAGMSDGILQAHENLLIDFLDSSPLKPVCTGITHEHLSLMDELLGMAVDAGDVSSVPQFISRGLEREDLLEYLRDPQAYSEFRRRALTGLEAGVRQCDLVSLMQMGGLHQQGILVPIDLERAFTAELVVTWLEGRDPASSIPLAQWRNSLDAARLNRSIAQAHQLYSRYCR